jgi:hypothetical protein
MVLHGHEELRRVQLSEDLLFSGGDAELLVQRIQQRGCDTGNTAHHRGHCTVMQTSAQHKVLRCEQEC